MNKIDQFALKAPQRSSNLDLTAAPLGKRLLEQVAILEISRDMNFYRDERRIDVVLFQ